MYHFKLCRHSIYKNETMNEWQWIYVQWPTMFLCFPSNFWIQIRRSWNIFLPLDCENHDLSSISFLTKTHTTYNEDTNQPGRLQTRGHRSITLISKRLLWLTSHLLLKHTCQSSGLVTQKLFLPGPPPIRWPFFLFLFFLLHSERRFQAMQGAPGTGRHPSAIGRDQTRGPGLRGLLVLEVRGWQ